MAPFIHGRDPSRFLHKEAVAPLLAQHFPTLPYAAELLFHGSEVLGLDTPQSRRTAGSGLIDAK